jgi:hypothetical protein
MAAPNDQYIIDRVFAAWRGDLSTDDGIGKWTEAAVAALHQQDPRWGHLRKNPGQSQYNGHAVNAALYLSDTPGQSQAVDMMRVGAPNPTPRWLLDTPRYSASDWIKPAAATPPPSGGTTPTRPQPPAVRLPSSSEAVQFGQWLDAFYAAPDGLQRPGGLSINGRPDWDGVGAWMFGVWLTARVNGVSEADARAQVVAQIQQSDEWKRKHGK